MRRRRGREPCSLHCGSKTNGSKFFLEKCHVDSVGPDGFVHDAAAVVVAAAAAAAAWMLINFDGLRELEKRVGKRSSGGKRCCCWRCCCYCCCYRCYCCC